MWQVAYPVIILPRGKKKVSLLCEGKLTLTGLPTFRRLATLGREPDKAVGRLTNE
jgi:hypothetical protein